MRPWPLRTGPVSEKPVSLNAVQPQLKSLKLSSEKYDQRNCSARRRRAVVKVFIEKKNCPPQSRRLQVQMDSYSLEADENWARRHKSGGIAIHMLPHRLSRIRSDDDAVVTRMAEGTGGKANDQTHHYNAD
jgi:hypothetical protein